MILKTEAIVLKTFDFRETSRIAIFFSKDYGKIKGILKGIRKTPGKFASSLDKFTVNDIVYYTHRHSDLHLVSQCDLKRFFSSVRGDIKKSVAAQYLLELVDVMMPLEEPNEKVYRLVVRALTNLEDTKDTNKLVHLFQIKMLNLSGFKPHINSCLVCHKKITSKVKFSSQMGGLLCPVCQKRDPAAHSISPGTVASLLYVQDKEWDEALRLGLTAPVKKELKYILNHFLVFHLERQLKSSKFMS